MKSLFNPFPPMDDAFILFVAIVVIVIGITVAVTGVDSNKSSVKITGSPITVEKVGEAAGKTTKNFTKGFFKGIFKKNDK
jgi:hypothetical protein